MSAGNTDNNDGKQEGTEDSNIMLNNFIYSANAKNHLINVEAVTGKTVSGGHNLFEFEKTLSNLHQDIGIEDIIINRKPHPTISGLYEIKYQLPMQKPGGIIAEPITFKEIKLPKTVYDPNIISDEEIFTWGKEAMETGVCNGSKVTAHSSNGMKFEGYFRNGEIINFYPVF